MSIGDILLAILAVGGRVAVVGLIVFAIVRRIIRSLKLAPVWVEVGRADARDSLATLLVLGRLEIGDVPPPGNHAHG